MTSTVHLTQQLFINYAIQIVGAIIILFIGWLVAKAIRALTYKIFQRRHVDDTIALFVTQLIFIGIIVFTVIAALAQLGLQTTSLVAALGALGLAVGLSLRNSLSNFAAGILLISFRTIRVGDYISVGSDSGTVEEVAILYTTLTTPGNQQVVIPNNVLMSNSIINYTINATRRTDLTIGISYDDDIQKAREVILQQLQAESRVLNDPEPLIAVTELADNSINILARYWTNSADAIHTRMDLLESIKISLDKAGITIPFPQRHVHVHQGQKMNPNAMLDESSDNSD